MDTEQFRKHGHKMVDWIAKDLEITTLRYQTIEDMVKAIGLPKEKLCLYCWTGKCPKEISNTKIQNSKSKKLQHAEK